MKASRPPFNSDKWLLERVAAVQCSGQSQYCLSQYQLTSQEGYGYQLQSRICRKKGAYVMICPER